MKDNAIMRDGIVIELMELRWRINKLEEMKNSSGGATLEHDIKNKIMNQSQSSQFFLSLGPSPVNQSKDKFRNEES